MDHMEKTLHILSNATGTNTELLNIKVSPGVGDIVVQLDVFDEQKESNKITEQTNIDNINLNSHLEVCQAVTQQVIKTPNEMIFLKILQHLLSIDPNEELASVMWKVAEKLVHRATQLDDSEEAEGLLNSCVSHKFSCQTCQAKDKARERVTEETEFDKETLATISDVSAPSSLPADSIVTSLPPSSTTPQTPENLSLAPSSTTLTSAPQTETTLPSVSLPSAALPPPPPLLGAAPSNILLFTQQCAPKSSKKLKSFNWTKIPPQKIVNKLNIWTMVTNDRQYKCVELIDFKGIEGLFALKTINKDVTDRVKKNKPKLIHLLNFQRSLKINIFLSQFKGYTIDDIVQLIRTGNHNVMNLDKLKDLYKFFNNEDEIIMLKSYTGDRQALADAEKFMISMLEVPNLKLRFDSMILKEQFAENVEYLEPRLNAIIKAANDLMKTKSLQEILSIIIIIGNFLNSGGYAGNAAGISLSSVIELTSIKANKPGMHLLHLVAIEVERYNPELLNLCHELSFLESVSKYNNDKIEQDIRDMDVALDIVKKEIYLPTTEEDIKQQMDEFLKEMEQKMRILNEKLEETKSLRIKLADFFCEDLKTFKLEECFQIFNKFCEQFKQTLEENKKRVKLEMQATIKQKQKEEQLAKKALKEKESRIQNESSASLTSESAKSSKGKRNIRETEKYRMKVVINSKKTAHNECINKRDNIGNSLSDRQQFNLETESNQQQSFSSLAVKNDPEIHISNAENILATQSLENEKRKNVLQKSWKQLMKSYKASRQRDKSPTPDVTPQRERLQIFVRSNSTVDSKLKRQPSLVKVIRTPLPKADSVFNFSQNEIQANQASNTCDITEAINETDFNCSLEKNSQQSLDVVKDGEESPVEMRRPKLRLKTMASIARIGCRYSSINEEDLKKTIKNLRTPTLEKSPFCFSPGREWPPRLPFSFGESTHIWHNEQGPKTSTSIIPEEKFNENIENNQ